MFKRGEFTSHAGVDLAWKIECDDMGFEDWVTLAEIAAEALEYRFSYVVGIPTGGTPFANELVRYARGVGGNQTLIVDDVYTTGTSMEKAREKRPGAIGLVAFARGATPDWIFPIFTLNEKLWGTKAQQQETWVEELSSPTLI